MLLVILPLCTMCLLSRSCSTPESLLTNSSISGGEGPISSQYSTSISMPPKNVGNFLYSLEEFLFDLTNLVLRWAEEGLESFHARPQMLLDAILQQLLLESRQ